MPSPFPGMDPFVESQAWEDFHNTAIGVIRESLTPSLRGRYTTWVERRVYLEHFFPNDEPVEQQIADVAVTARHSPADGAIPGAVASLAPVAAELAMPAERHETYLVIRRRETSEVVAIIELLSPSNKKPGGDGQREYIAKREAIIDTRTHLVELDLLRGGARPPIRTSSPVADYLAVVSRGFRRPDAEVYTWPLTDRLPILPVPLAGDDPDVPLDLQLVLDTVYDRGDYEGKLDYSAPLVPPADEQTRKWITETLDRRPHS